MALGYGVISTIALIFAGVCVAVDRKKEVWLLMLFISVFICDAGYFLLSISKSLEWALLSNRIAYFGSVFLPFFMMMIIFHLCKIHYPRWLPAILISIAFVIFLITASPGYLTIYYKTVSVEFVDGITRLVREYGPLHILYYIYLFLYSAVMLLTAAYSIVKKKIEDPICGVILSMSVLINLVVWLIEQSLPHSFEFLSISYILSEALILCLYGTHEQNNMRQRAICTWTMGLFCIGIALLCKFCPASSPNYYFLNMLRTFIYIGMYYAWGRIVCRGVIQKSIRRCLGGISMLLILWLLIHACKHFVFAQNVDIVRYLWYAYYIPQVMIAVLCLVIAAMVGKGDSAQPGKWCLALFGGGIALILFVMTNDLHQLAFSFPEGQPWTNESCTHEFGYYLVMTLIALCGIAALMLLVIKCRIPERKRMVGIPFLALTFMIAYCVLYFVEGSFVKLYLNDMTAASCVMIAAMLEILLESGLLQTNISYDSLFQKSILAVQITDCTHQVRFTSEYAHNVPVELLIEADAAPVKLDRATRLSGAKIRGGYVYWEENVEDLLSVQEKLEMTQEELRDTGDVLKAASGQTAYRLHLEMENRLYDMVETKTASQVAMLREMTAQLRQTEDLHLAKRILSKIVIVGTYIKRRSNLIFVAGQDGEIRMEELLLCMNESAQNLKLYGVDCKVGISGCETLAPEMAYTMYDLLEAVVEKGMDTASSLLVHGEPERGGIAFSICMDCSDDLTPLCQAFPELAAWRDEDGLWYLDMMIAKKSRGGYLIYEPVWILWEWAAGPSHSTFIFHIGLAAVSYC